MKKPKAKQKAHQKKRARKEAKRRQTRKVKMKKHKELMLMLNRMSDEELREFLGEDFDEEDEDYE